MVDIVLPNIPNGSTIYVKLPSGEDKLFAVNQMMATKRDIINQMFRSLVGEPITVNDVVSSYNVPRRNVLEWVKNQYISVIKSGSPGIAMLIDHADAAYCVYVYKRRGGVSGVPLLDENGNPYQFKRPRSIM